MYSLIKEKRSLRKGNGLFINYRYLAKVKEKGNQDRYEEGAQHSVEYGKNYRFFICIFQKYRKCGILTGCGSRGDTGAVIQLCCDYGNQEKGEKFSHEITHKSDTSKLCSPQTADGDTCQAVPSHTACHSCALVYRDSQDQGAKDSAQNGSGSDTQRDDQNLQVILTYFFRIPLCIPILMPTENIRTYRIISEFLPIKRIIPDSVPESPQKSPRIRAKNVNTTIIGLSPLSLFCQ